MKSYVTSAADKKRFVASIVRGIGSNKNAPRVWLQGSEPARAGFTPGTAYDVVIDEQRNMVRLEVTEQGMRVVSSKSKSLPDVPVIDLNSHKVLSLFEGLDQVRVILHEGVIYILPLASEARRKLRENEWREYVETGKPIPMSSVSHGGGILDHALHNGMQQAGFKTKLAWACDIREDMLEHARRVNEVWDKDTVAVAMPLQELAFDEYVLSRLPKSLILSAGIPCEASSASGRAKNGTSCAEQHEHVGHLIAGFLAIVARVNPVLVQVENVVPYMNTSSMWIMRHQLRDLGYVVFETVIDGADWNVLEHRKRMVMVAVSKGLAHTFDFNDLVFPAKQTLRLGDVLEPIAEDADNWSEFKYLIDKLERDRSAGKGFEMQIFNEESTRVSTIGKGYSKIRSTEPKISHPTNPKLMRQLTVTEHARCKGIPDHLTVGGSQTFCHEMLGQSVIHPPFIAIGELIGNSLRAALSVKACVAQAHAAAVEDILAMQDIPDEASADKVDDKQLDLLVA